MRYVIPQGILILVGATLLFAGEICTTNSDFTMVFTSLEALEKAAELTARQDKSKWVEFYKQLKADKAVFAFKKGVAVELLESGLGPTGSAARIKLAGTQIKLYISRYNLICGGVSKEEGRRLFFEGKALQEKASSKDDYRKALEKFTGALEHYSKVGYDEGVAFAHSRIGQCHFAMEQHPAAIESFQKSLEMLRSFKSHNSASVAIVLNYLGAVYKKCHQLQKAEDCMKQALSIHGSNADPRDLGIILVNLGGCQEDLKKLKEACKSYQQAVSYFRKARDSKSEGLALNDLGTTQSKLGQYEEAIESLELSLDLRRKIGPSKAVVTTYHNLADAYGYRGDYEAALKNFNIAMAIARRIQYKRGQILVLNGLGRLYSERCLFGKAINKLRAAIAIENESTDPRLRFDTLSQMGNVYNKIGRIKESAEYAHQALDAAHQCKDPDQEIVALNNMAYSYRDLSKYRESLEHFHRALSISGEMGNRSGLAYIHDNLGRTYLEWGRYPEALNHFQEALRKWEELSYSKEKIFTLRNICDINRRLGRYDLAETYCSKASALSRQFNNFEEENIILNILGEIYTHQEKPEMALTKIKEALPFFEAAGVHANRSRELVASLCLDMGKIDEARRYAILSEGDAVLGRLHLMELDYAGAKEHFQKLLDRAERDRRAHRMFAAYTGLGLAFEGLGNHKEAERYYQLGKDFVEDLRESLNEEQRERLFDVRVNGSFRTAPYEGLARVLMKTGRPVQALTVSEFTKARVFSEKLSARARGESSQLSQELLERDRRLNDELSALKARRVGAYGNGDLQLVTALDPQIMSLRKQLEAHVTELREKHPQFAGTKYPTPVDLARTAVEKTEWVLAYDVTDLGVLIWLIHGKQLMTSKFVSVRRKDLKNLVNKCLDPLKVARPQELDSKLAGFCIDALKKVSKILLDDVRAELPPERTPLTIVPDEFLGALPFEMLLLSESGELRQGRGFPQLVGAEFVGDRRPISYQQSITALTLTRNQERERIASRKLLVIADPVYKENEGLESNPSAPQTVELSNNSLSEQNSGGALQWLKDLYRRLMSNEEYGLAGGPHFPRLTMTSDLLEALEASYGDRVESLKRWRASKSVLLTEIAPHLDQYDKIVIAVHGYFGKDLPGISEPVLVLTLVPPGTDGYLRMNEVMGLKMNASLVALTACQSGVGPRIAGEGVMGMGRAFQLAGARSVLMSLWNVSELKSVELVQRFLDYVEKGKSKHEALRLARKDVRRDGFDHPFWWASFILVGESD